MLLARLESGEQITVSRRGTLNARLIGVAPTAKRRLGVVSGGPIANCFFDALPEDELRHW